MIDPAGGRRAGFPGQRMQVVPRSILRQALQAPLTSRQLVSDCGYFPHAAGHRRSRPNGAGQAIMLLCTEGAGWVSLGTETYEVRPGQVTLIPPRTGHSYGADDVDPWTIWWMHVVGEDVPDLLAAAMAGGAPVFSVPDINLLVSLMRELVSSLERDDTMLSLLGASGVAWHVWTLLATRRHREALPDDPVELAKELLTAGLDHNYSVAELAHAAGLSSSHFAALFRRSTGHGVIAYQTMLRMARARELLDTTLMSVGQIARSVGYEDPAYFSRRFRILHEISPRQYRHLSKG